MRYLCSRRTLSLPILATRGAASSGSILEKIKVPANTAAPANPVAPAPAVPAKIAGLKVFL